MATLTFHGAASTVTGSKTLLESGADRLLVDCGMFQGLKSLRERNWAPPAFDAHGLGWVVLTHAHIDHCGWLPRLVKAGFRGRVVATPATAELAEVLLMDAARLQEEDADFLNRKRVTKHRPALPLYDESDARRALERIETVTYGDWKEITPRMAVRLHNAGHLLGSAMVEVVVEGGSPGEVRPGASPAPNDPSSISGPGGEGAAPMQVGTSERRPRHQGPTRGRFTILFSGDVGRYGAPLAPDPAPPVPCDFLVMESTYGDRTHGQRSIQDELVEVAKRTFDRGGVLLVPAFAVGRAQQVIFVLRQLYELGRLARVPIHVDSPMAVDATRIYGRYRAELDTLRSGRDDPRLLESADVFLHRSRNESKQLNTFEGPGVIISSSGMLTGGRILHHLARRLPDPRNTVLLVGYQAQGTRGRTLCEGARHLRFHGEQVEVRAEVAQLHGLSGHADGEGLLRWTQHLEAPSTVFLTHGEPPAAQTLARRLRDERGWNAVVPELHQSFNI